MSEKKRNFLIHGSILAMAGILVRIIGMLYRIPLVNIIGSEGNGIYSAAYRGYTRKKNETRDAHNTPKTLA